MPDLQLRCACGALRGVLRDARPATLNRVACSCRGCQRFARALGREAEILDERGGTDIFQASPAKLEFSAGAEHIVCCQQTPKGALRWYAACCQSPIANTLSRMNVPFMGLVHTIIDREALSVPLDEVLGPVRVWVNGRFDPEEAKRLRATRWALVTMLLRYAPMLLRWRVRGDHKRWPFNTASLPRVTAPTCPELN